MALAAAPLAWLLRGRPEAAAAGQRAVPEKSMRAAVRDALRDPASSISLRDSSSAAFHVAFIATHCPASRPPPASCRLKSRRGRWSLIGLFNIAGSFTAAGRSGAGA